MKITPSFCRHALTLALIAAGAGLGSFPLSAADPTPAPARETRASLSLDGSWRIVFDRENVGKSRSWHRPEEYAKEAARQIAVPSCWEQSEQDYEGVAWYAKTFSIPETWKGRHLRLHFDAVNYIAEVWLNGEIAGCHEGGYTPFDLEVSDLLSFGQENTLVVRVTGPAVLKDSVDGLARDDAPHWRGAYVGGIWQSVNLIATDPVFTEDIFVEPNLRDSTALVHAQIANTTVKPVQVTVTFEAALAADPELTVSQKTLTLNLQPGTLGISETLPIAQAKLWAPDSPNLYRVRVSIAAARPLDGLSARFAMREFTVREGDFYLNGKKLFIKGGFWEGFYPLTLARPSDPEIVRREIRLAKEAGFNLLRPWRHPPPPMILDLADEMGILIVGSPPIECMGFWPAETPQLEQRWTSEMEQMVLRDRNHPCIVMWETSNEIDRRSLMLMRHRVSLSARRLDPTRLIVDESGGARAPWGSHVYLPGQTAPISVYDRHIYVRSPLNEPDRERLNSIGDPHELTFISEVGYGGFPDLPRDVARYDEAGPAVTPDYRYHHRLLATLEKVMADHMLYDLFPTPLALCLAGQDLQASGNKLQIEALRTNPNADGYCLHAFTDGDWVVGAGVLDIWREPKRVYAALKEVNQPLYLAIQATSPNVYAQRGTRLVITAVNDGPAVVGELAISIDDARGKEIWSAHLSATAKTGISPFFDRGLDTALWSGLCTVHVRLGDGPHALAENRFDLFVVGADELKPPLAQIATFGPPSPLQQFLAHAGVADAPFSGNGAASGPVLVAASDAGTEQEMGRFVELMDYVRRGGTAVFLKPPSRLQPPQPTRYDESDKYLYQLLSRNRDPQTLSRRSNRSIGLSNKLIETGVFPLDLRFRIAVGNWVCVGHYTRQHPIFAGLPTDGFMGQPYRNVAARHTLLGLPGSVVAGSVSWDLIEKNYLGPGDAWHGADLAVVPLGRGRMILSTLQILDNLGTDPVADKLFMNLIRFAATFNGPLDPAPDGQPQRIAEAIEKFRSIRNRNPADSIRKP